MKELKDQELTNKTVILRAAFDVPLEREGSGYKVVDSSRIKDILPTIEYLIKHNTRIVILSWIGRPDKRDRSKSLKCVTEELAALIKTKVDFCPQSSGGKVIRAKDGLKPGEILVLENVRFEKAERDKDFTISGFWASLADFCVFDAFAQGHRDVPSTTGILKLLPSCAGFAFKREMENITELKSVPKRPFTVIMGGAKIHDKLELIESLLPKADQILLGGALANTVLAATGVDVGQSVVDEKADFKKLKELAVNSKIFLPVDLVAASKIEAGVKEKNIELAEEEIPKGWFYLDIGEKTIEKYREIIKRSNTVFWNGPMGYTEIEKFQFGTSQVAFEMESVKHAYIGGGDTIAVLKGKLNRFKFVSMGGGATLEFLAGKELPVLKYLK